MLGSMAVMGTAFMSCSKDIAYDSEGLAKEATQKLVAEYDANFVKKYGPVDPNQTWDFTTKTPIRTLPSMSATTRGGEDPVEITVSSPEEGWMTIDQSVITWMHDKMPKGQNNSGVGSPFYSVASKSSFTIVPFYQGVASYFWELWVNIGGKDIKIWEKYKDLEYKGADKDWHSLDGQGVPPDASEIKAPTYTFTATKGANMYFFLKVWTGANAAAADNAHEQDPDGNGTNVKRLTSLESGIMRALENVPGVEKPSDDKFVYIIGCEDASDKDYEDLAFLFIGPRAQRVDEVEDRVTTRYMMEDLGDTNDFDFNDVVVDVSDVTKKQIIWKENIVTGEMEQDGESPTQTYQEAIVRAAGGIYDFTLTIGDTEWSKSQKLDVPTMWNTGWKNTSIDYSKVLDKFVVTGWDKNTNNVSLEVHFPESNQSAGQVMTIEFPRKGDPAPKMIAVEASKNWMNEKVCVPGPNDPNPWWYWTKE